MAAPTTGRRNARSTRDLDVLFDFTSDRVGTLSGVEAWGQPILRQIKQAGTRVSGDRLIEAT